MNQQLNRKYYFWDIVILVSVLFLWSQQSHASGGWVGNSPASYMTMPTLNSDGFDSHVSKKQNSLLLREGQSSLSLGNISGQQTKLVPQTYFPEVVVTKFSRNYFNYEYGLTDDLTIGPFYARYSLIANNGVGSELAIAGGADVLLDYDGNRPLLLPYAELIYSYNFQERWKFLLNPKIVKIAESSFDRTYMNLNLGILYKVSKKWTVGAQYSNLYRQKRSEIPQVAQEIQGNGLGLYASYKVTENLEIEFMVSDYQYVGLKYSW
jgi:hypothetical protein